MQFTLFFYISVPLAPGSVNVHGEVQLKSSPSRSTLPLPRRRTGQRRCHSISSKTIIRLGFHGTQFVSGALISTVFLARISDSRLARPII
jgi:hypothetical protein